VSCYYAEVGFHLNGQPRLTASHERSHLYRQILAKITKRLSAWGVA